MFSDLGQIAYCFITKDDGDVFGNFKCFTAPILEALHQMGATGAELSGRNDLLIDGKKFSGNTMSVKADSYFVAEIKSLKRVLDKVKTQERCYCFVDEILRETNTVERIAASSSIINWIDDYPSLAFIATHDIELTEMLKDQCDNVHFKEEVTSEDGIEFDYKLQKGPATSRNALLLLGNMDFPIKVVEQAKEKASYFDQTQEWLGFDTSFN